MSPERPVAAGPVAVSVVSPFFNEAAILENALEGMLARLRDLDRSWELIVVNDGSVDGSEEIARRIAAAHPGLVVLGYPVNRGRGHALRTGIRAARGEVIVTTEIDLSWGDGIVADLVAAMDRWPEADIVIASPNLDGGGYRNVPAKRVRLSRLGNRIIRACLAHAPTMNTGMTRAYRRAAVRALPLFEDGKEFHLEVVLKALAFGYRIREIPATLEWKDLRRSKKAPERKSSSKINRLIVSHTLFSLLANPVRYVWALSLASLLGSGISLVLAIVAVILGGTSAYMALLGLSLAILALILFLFGVVLKQGKMIQQELWTVQRFFLEAEEARRR